MKFTIKINKGTNNIVTILDFVNDKIREIVRKGFYSKKEKCWVNELQRSYIINIEIKENKK